MANLSAFAPFDYGNVLAQAESIKGARMQNALMQQEQDPNSNRNQLLKLQLENARRTGEQQATQFEQQNMTFGQQQNQYAQQQMVESTKLANMASAEIMANPTAIKRWLPSLQQSGVIAPDFDPSQFPLEQIQDTAKTIYESTSAALGVKPQGPDIMTVSPGATAIDKRTGKPIFTAPTESKQVSPDTLARISAAERMQKQKLAAEEAKRNAPARQGPMSSTLQKELIESDDVVQSSKNVVDILTQAKKLNETAYSGFGAGVRAKVMSNIYGTEAADATVDLDNMMTGQALESLKTIFGGMPTEGERKVLLDMQATSDKTPEQRGAIIDRAITLAKVRQKFNAKRASDIRSGKYLTEDAASQADGNIDDLVNMYGD